MKQYKRQYRQLSDETKNKISTSTRNKPKTEIHKRHIQQSMLRYWNSVPNKPEDLSMDDFLNGNNDDRQLLPSLLTKQGNAHRSEHEVGCIIPSVLSNNNEVKPFKLMFIKCDTIKIRCNYKYLKEMKIPFNIQYNQKKNKENGRYFNSKYSPDIPYNVYI